MPMQVTNAKFKNVNIVGSDCKFPLRSPRELLMFKSELSNVSSAQSLASS